MTNAYQDHISELTKEQSKEQKFLMAVEDNNYFSVERFLKVDPAIIHMKHFNSGYPLISLTKSVDVARLLLENGADPNGASDNNNRPLHVWTDPTCVAMLLKYAADPNVKNYLDQTPLHLAIRKNEIECARLLLDHKADPNAVDRNGYLPLHYNNHDIADLTLLLLENNANANAGINRFNLLSNARTPEIAKHLLEHGAEIGINREEDEKMIQRFIEFGCHEVAETIRSFIQNNENLLIKPAK